ncbi:MAG: hypothetical protein ACD_75C00976G0002 [uncultured bacterium]|nr:MAG: hypothetical protein ACD_75C00976G0002 [uncultured bacterium]
MAETAGDLGGAAEDSVTDNRGRADHIVKDDGQPSADILFGKVRKDLAAMAGQVKADIRFIETAADSHLGVFDHVTGHQDLVFQKDRSDCCFLGNLVDLFLKVDGGVLRQLVLQRPIELGEALALLPLVGRSCLPDQLLQIQAGRIGNKFEFQLSGFAEEFEGALGILDAGQLNDNFVLALANNYGLGNAELVDPVSQDFQRLVNCIVLDEVLLFFLQGENDTWKTAFPGLDLRVDIRKIFGDQILHFFHGSGIGQREDYRVGAGGRCPHRTDRLFAQRVFQIVGGKLERVQLSLLEIDFQDQVHSTLQVETQTQSFRSKIGFPPGGGTGKKRRNHRGYGEKDDRDEKGEFQLECCIH